MHLIGWLKTASDGPRAAISRLWPGDEGVSTVELALIAPFLALLIIGMIDYGTAYTRSLALANAVRAGTQYAMIRRPIQGDISAIKDAVINAAPAPKIGVHNPDVQLLCACSPSDTTLLATGTCGCADELTYVQITLQEQYPLILSYPGFDNPITLAQGALMRLN